MLDISYNKLYQYGIDIDYLNQNSDNYDELEKILREILNNGFDTQDNQLILTLIHFLFNYKRNDLVFKYDFLDEWLRKSEKSASNFILHCLYDKDSELVYDDEKITYILLKNSLNNKKNFFKELGIDNINDDLNLYVNEYNKIGDYIQVINNISNNINAKNEDFSNNENIINNEEEILNSLLYNSIIHKEYFGINDDYLENNLNDLTNIINNINKDSSNFKQILLFLLNLELKKNGKISSNLLDLIKGFSFDEFDYDLIDNIEDKENLLSILSKNNDNYSLGLIFFNKDFKGIQDTKKWIEELVYDYKGYFIGYSKDKKRTQNTLNIYSRQSKLRVVVYNNNSTLFVIDKNKIINNDILVFTINNSITKDYFDKSMKNIIKDFINNSLNKSEGNNFKISAKSKFFIS